MFFMKKHSVRIIKIQYTHGNSIFKKYYCFFLSKFSTLLTAYFVFSLPQKFLNILRLVSHTLKNNFLNIMKFLTF